MYNLRDYFVIGDLHTAALVSKYGSIDWLCLPHFDSASLFAALLDPSGGTFAIEAPTGFSIKSKYLKDTAVVEHTYRKDDTTFTVKDFMVPQPMDECENHFLVRKIVGISGDTRVTVRFEPQPDYARQPVKIEQVENSLRFETHEHTTWLHLPDSAKIRQEKRGFLIEIPVAQGITNALILEYASGQVSLYHGQEFEEGTTLFWREWVSRGHFFTFCRDQLVRSAIVLKLMQFYPTGGIVAAPTTSLPEEIGGVRNWDYRYVWVRDATFTLYAFYVLGYTEEAIKFFGFIESVAKECEDCDIEVRLMYTIRGKPAPKEVTLDNFTGYKHSQPVRIGNGAADQFQLDVYGSLIDAHYFMSKRGVPLTKKSREIVLDLLDKIKKRWLTPDNGIWEMRIAPKHFTYSKVMAWVGVNRAQELCKLWRISEDKHAELKILEKEIFHWIWQHCFDSEKKIFRQHTATDKQDATTLLFVPLKFLDRHDSLTKTIIRNTLKELRKNKVFIDRYHTKDGLEGGEGSFILCTFWLISALAMVDEVEEAEHLFQIFLTYLNEAELLPEEMDAQTQEYLGNYPQAFSHMGFIMSAFYLSKYRERKNNSS